MCGLQQECECGCVRVHVCARVCVCAPECECICVCVVYCKWKAQTLGTGKGPCLNVVWCYKFILDLILSMKGE